MKESFSVQVKSEILSDQERSACCLSAHLYGVMLFSRVFSAHKVIFSSEYPPLTEHAGNLLLDFGINRDKLVFYKTARDTGIRITDAETIERVLNDFGYAGDEPSFRVNRVNFLCDSCVAAFVSGCFLAAGSVTDPQKGYHLEFSTNKGNLFGDMVELLESEGFEPRTTSRGYAKIIYYKNSTQIEDMLTYMGAVGASLEVMNTKIYKDIVNTVNRRTNCENANIDKIVNSAARDREAIELIFFHKGRECLTEDLLEIAQLRLNNPELPLGELGEMTQKKLSKSGVSHRLRRLREIAHTLKEQPE